MNRRTAMRVILASVIPTHLVTPRAFNLRQGDRVVVATPDGNESYRVEGGRLVPFGAWVRRDAIGIFPLDRPVSYLHGRRWWRFR